MRRRVPDAALRERVYRAIVDDGALLNNAATEEGGGSPARGAIPGTIGRSRGADGTWRLTGEKTWTTWLPDLTHAFVTARVETRSGEVGTVPGRPRRSPACERLPGFEALGMRGSASGRLVLEGAAGELVGRRRPTSRIRVAPPRAPGSAIAIAADVPRGRGGRPG